VVVPVTAVSRLPWSQVLTISLSSSAVIVEYTNVPDSVPSSVIQSVPSTAVISKPSSFFSAWTIPSYISPSVSASIVAKCNAFLE